ISKESDRTFREAYPDVTSNIIYNGTRKPAPGLQFNVVEKYITDIRKNEDTRIFVHIGRLKHQKNQLLLIAAFKKLLMQHANALLIIIGSEREEIGSHKIASAIKEACALYSNIVWVGGNQPATDYLMCADFFCLSSIYEGMPISLIESFATGCVPVCTPVGGIPEMLNGKGFLAKDLSEDAYYNVLAEAYTCSKEKLLVFKNEFISLFNEKYTMKSCSAEYEKIYKELLAENNL
ncbi:MAG: glycosyltransferase family 4 protein, partial [Parafilimonas sp.]